MNNKGFEKLDITELENLSAVGGNDSGVTTSEYGTPTIAAVSAGASFIAGISVSLWWTVTH
jgi:hypothetical protein